MKNERQIKKPTKREREQEIAEHAFDYGKKQGKRDIINKLVELLELDSRFQGREE